MGSSPTCSTRLNSKTPIKWGIFGTRLHTRQAIGGFNVVRNGKTTKGLAEAAMAYANMKEAAVSAPVAVLA